MATRLPPLPSPASSACRSSFSALQRNTPLRLAITPQCCLFGRHQLKFANSKPKAAAVSYRSSSSSLASSSLSSATNASSASGARGPSGSLPAHNRPLVKTFLCNFAQDHQGFCLAERWSKLVLGIRSSNGMERVQGGVVGSRQHVCQLPFQLGRRRHSRHYMSREPTRVPRIPDRETAEPASVSVLRDLRHLHKTTRKEP